MFVDGCFWHACPTHLDRPKSNTDYWKPKLDRNRARDHAVDAALTAAGWRVLRIWEHEPIEQAVSTVVGALAEGDRPERS